jgi:hypothetical protein
MTDAQGFLDAVDWCSTVRCVMYDGWCRVPDAISARQAVRLVNAAPQPWHPLPRNEGGNVYQEGFAAFSTLDRADLNVRNVALSLTRSLGNAAPAGSPALPAFNDVSWTRYPEGAGHITGHRDPSSCGGVVAVLTLAGTATFYVGPSRDHSIDSWQTSRGDLVILRGYGWPTGRSRCVEHGVEPPPVGERLIMTLRHNRGGAGAGYFSSS